MWSSISFFLCISFQMVCQSDKMHYCVRKLYIIYLFIYLFIGHTCGIWRFPGWGLIGSTTVSLCESHSNARSLTHWVGPGIEPVTSWVPSQIRFCCATAGMPYFYYFLLFRLYPQQYGSSQARGWIRAAAASLLSHSQMGSLSEARDRTHILMDTSWVHYCRATLETPKALF